MPNAEATDFPQQSAAGSGNNYLREARTTRSNRSRDDAARATAIASNGPVRSSAESMPRIARMTLPTGLLSGCFWINT